MVFISKENKTQQYAGPDEKVQKAEPKRKSDNAIKPSAPRSTAGKKVLRTFFWVFACLLVLKGAIAFAQGNRTINQTIINGDTDPAVSDLVKGFAADFATEYFTWDASFVENRNQALNKFVKNVESQMALKAYDTKVSSKVNAAEVYSTNIIDPKHIDVTVVVWRDVTPLPDQVLAAQGKASTPPITKKKTYMIVPITLASDGPVITSLPRFVPEIIKGSNDIAAPDGKNINDPAFVQKAADLADSYLRSWYEGNTSQIKYFYEDSVKTPSVLQKSDFTYDKIDKVSVYQVDPVTYRVEASVYVKSDMGESFMNNWALKVTQTEGKLYILSNGNDDVKAEASTSQTTESTPALTPDNAVDNPSSTSAQ